MTTEKSVSGLFSTRRRHLMIYNNNKRRFQMKPFWKSSSSSSDDEDRGGDDDDDNNNDAENREDGQEQTLSNSSKYSSSSNNSNDMTTTAAATTTTTTSSNDDHKSLITLLNEVGQNFKPLAQKATAKGYQAESQGKKILYAMQACIYYSLFILYRAYRGLFVLMPAVFRQVYQKMEAAMNSGNLSLETTGATNNNSSSNTEKATWRTKLTVSVLASVVTMSYVLGGTIQMLSKFVRTITKTSSVSKSFQAAAEGMEEYEEKISRVGKINGENDIKPGGLAP
jgi:hypothetical protein